MDRLFTYILFLLSLSGTFSKYIYIKDQKTWNDAQNYCRERYTDLAPVSNKQDLNRLQKMINPPDLVWVGLQRISSTKNWTWSGGGPLEVGWANGQPDNGNSDTNGYINDKGLSDGKASDKWAFFCYRAIVVKEKKTWEEALEYCRKTYSDLASVASVTEMLLIQRELKKQNTTGPFWIGLHFFFKDWLWVDGQELRYASWGQGVKPTCPEVQSAECAALQAMKWLTSDTTSASSGTSPFESVFDLLANSLWRDTAALAATVYNSGGVWGAHNCEEKLNFICY
ncbi:trinucleotide repeat-containing protein [Sarotherodon galilaeus]